MGSFYLHQAVRQLVHEDHKALVLERLAKSPELAEVVSSHGWARDARVTLIDGLHRASDYLPTEWIHAVAGFRDASTYADLRAYLEHGENPSSTYDAIKDLPGIDLGDVIARKWQQAVNQSPENPDVDWAGIATQFGHSTALESLVKILRDAPYDFQKDAARRALMGTTEARGNNEEILRWYQENQGRLIFDPIQRRFVAH